ncbi:cytochrome b/b6 domain-containing protein [Asticcacaulis sp. 201]|uniref:cytochrome b/b6 domain-containing protein n=1 Tax=Asticcacaulis sp. 201 TaxID=3028787 RepID=UPI002916ABDB|nr:cytochrome b/b6 domain-containing protein [Asticcacaulis sp. 201]MDV6332414.1 cytochrome b/b6 domain-containing protein [Asticcacaulis sp. 201]
MSENGDKSSVHPLWLRLIHWFNAAAVIVLILSGWRIYNATRFMHLRVPFTGEALFPNRWTIGGWLGGAIQWHFAAIWVLFASAVFYILLFLLTRRGKQFLPVTPSGLWADIKAFLKGKLSHADIRQYNTIQKLAYLFAMADLVVLIASGLVLWKSVQFGWLRVLLGGYEAARYIHFYAMCGIVAFIVIHVVMAVLVPKTIKAMLWGR